MTARTNASKVKLKRVLYYEDTKLRKEEEEYIGRNGVSVFSEISGTR